MSAIGTKRTWKPRWRMSALERKADIDDQISMSASDPKRTFSQLVAYDGGATAPILRLELLQLIEHLRAAGSRRRGGQTHWVWKGAPMPKQTGRQLATGGP